jgi:regulator of protease activity HflC (stomatin/prohibitin superfamily)
MSDKYLSDPSDEDFEKESAPFSCGGCLLGFLCLPFCCCSIFTVQEREEVVALQCGKFKEVFRQPGLHYQTCCGRELRRVSKTKISVSLPNVKILDLTGAPLIVSGVVVYSYGNTKRVAIDVQDASSFLKNQATCVMKSVVSRYPYENWDDDPNAHTLKTEGETIAQELVDTLQRAVKLAGVTVHTFQINEISYSAEVAQGMFVGSSFFWPKHAQTRPDVMSSQQA